MASTWSPALTRKWWVHNTSFSPCLLVMPDSCRAAYTPSSLAFPIYSAPLQQLFTIFTSCASRRIMSAFSWGRGAKSKTGRKKGIFFSSPGRLSLWQLLRQKALPAQWSSYRQMFLLMEARCITIMIIRRLLSSDVILCGTEFTEVFELWNGSLYFQRRSCFLLHFLWSACVLKYDITERGELHVIFKVFGFPSRDL